MVERERVVAQVTVLDSEDSRVICDGFDDVVPVLIVRDSAGRVRDAVHDVPHVVTELALEVDVRGYAEVTLDVFGVVLEHVVQQRGLDRRLIEHAPPNETEGNTVRVRDVRVAGKLASGTASVVAVVVGREHSRVVHIGERPSDFVKEQLGSHVLQGEAGSVHSPSVARAEMWCKDHQLRCLRPVVD